MKNKLQNFVDAVRTHRKESSSGFRRNITHNGKHYVLKAKFREYGYIVWSIWHNNKELAYSDKYTEFINFKGE